MRRISMFAAIAFLATASAAYAEEIDFWNFRGNIPRETNVNNLTTVERLPQGLHIQTSTDGFVVWPALGGPAEVMTIRARAARTTEVFFLWEPVHQEEGMYQLPFAIPGGNTSVETDVILNHYPSWDPDTRALGMAFKAGSDVLIEDITFRHWTPMERFIEGWKSFWTFDQFRAYSINFLWGPLIAGSAPARETLFESLPPFAWSAMRIFYGMLAAAGIIALLIKYIFKRGALALAVFGTMFAFIWVLLDVRMGLEILSYARDDFRTYVTQEGGDQTLRSHGNMYAVIHEMLPEIRKHERFALVMNGQSVFYPNVRYMAYPSQAVLEGQDRTGIKLWVMFERPDITVDDQGRLGRAADPAVVPGGREFLSEPGRIIMDFHGGTFLFQEL